MNKKLIISTLTLLLLSASGLSVELNDGYNVFSTSDPSLNSPNLENCGEDVGFASFHGGSFEDETIDVKSAEEDADGDISGYRAYITKVEGENCEITTSDSDSGDASSYTIGQGWNLISVPRDGITPEDLPSLGNCFTTTPTTLELTADTVEEDGEESIDVNAEQIDSSEELSKNKGYLVRTDSDCELIGENIAENLDENIESIIKRDTGQDSDDEGESAEGTEEEATEDNENQEDEGEEVEISKKDSDYSIELDPESGKDIEEKEDNSEVVVSADQHGNTFTTDIDVDDEGNDVDVIIKNVNGDTIRKGDCESGTLCLMNNEFDVKEKPADEDGNVRINVTLKPANNDGNTVVDYQEYLITDLETEDTTEETGESEGTGEDSGGSSEISSSEDDEEAGDGRSIIIDKEERFFEQEFQNNEYIKNGQISITARVTEDAKKIKFEPIFSGEEIKPERSLSYVFQLTPTKYDEDILCEEEGGEEITVTESFNSLPELIFKDEDTNLEICVEENVGGGADIKVNYVSRLCYNSGCDDSEFTHQEQFEFTLKRTQ